VLFDSFIIYTFSCLYQLHEICSSKVAHNGFKDMLSMGFWMMTVQGDRKGFLSSDKCKWLYVAFFLFSRVLGVPLFRTSHDNTSGMRSL
jgi:hypothetical protein